MFQNLRHRVGAASWCNSSQVCAYSDADRHLGHIVRAGEGWIAFDATHAATHGNGFLPLGYFRSVTTAMEAVQLATDPESERFVDLLRETVV